MSSDSDRRHHDPVRTDTTLLLDIKSDLSILQLSMATLLEDRRDASASRSKIYDKLEQVDDRASAAEQAATSARERVNEFEKRIEPQVEMLVRERHERVGALRLGRWLYGLIAAVAGAGASLLVKLIEGGRTPH